MSSVKKVFSLILCLFIIVACVGCNDSRTFERDNKNVPSFLSTEFDVPTNPDGFAKVASDGNIELYVNKGTTMFYVLDSSNGKKWYSSPLDYEQDEFAFGMFKMELASNLIFSYVTPSTKEESRANTYTGSVMDKNFKVSKIDNGVRFDYSFSEFSLEVPMVVYLQNGRLNVRVLLNEITCENDDFIMRSISLLPFFGAGGVDDDGYMLVPDGSGGVIEFNNGKNSNAAYLREIYGKSPYDLAAEYNSSTEKQSVTMPVFGIKNNNGAYLAIIEEGDALCNIKALTNMMETSYASVYAQFEAKDSMYYTVGTSTSGLVESEIYERNEFSIPHFAVSYSFLNGNEASYSGMARAYNKYLVEKDMLPTNNDNKPALFVDMYASVEKSISIAGVPFKKNIALTDTDAVKDMIESIKNAGVDSLVVRYNSWNKDEVNYRLINSTKMASSVEGKTGFDELFNLAGVSFYPSVNRLLTFRNGDNILSKNLDSASDLAGVPYKFKDRSIGIARPEGKSWYIISGRSFLNNASKFINAISKANFKSVGINDVANLLYNDYGDGSIKRTDIKDVSIKSIHALSETVDSIIMDKPNIYAVKYASDIINVPDSSSGYDLIDYDVPFLQIALGGAVRYASTPLNLVGQEKKSYLKVIETGANLHYSWIAEDTSLIYDTDMTFLYGADMNIWLSKAAGEYKEISEIYSATEGSRMIAHEKNSDGLFTTFYENGTKIIVNYNLTEAVINGCKVSGESYLVVKE